MLKAIEIKSAQLKASECEILGLRQEVMKLKMNESSLPSRIEELEQSLVDIQLKLQNQEHINQQIEFNNDINNERNLWKIERKNTSVKLNQKDRKYTTLKSMHDLLATENQDLKKQHKNASHEQQDYYEKLIRNYELKLKNKRLKIHKQQRMLLNKHNEFEKYRKKHKLMRKHLSTKS